jgi:malonyl-CoA O-methyltransferase
LDTEYFELSYISPQALMRELKSIGATNAHSARRNGLGGRANFRMMLDHYQLDAAHRAPATYEVIFAIAKAPPAGVPVKTAGVEVASIPVSAIRRRKV